MIVDVIIFVAAAFLQIIAFILSGFNYVIPTQFTTAISGYISYFNYAHGLVPVVATPGYTGLAGSIGLYDVFGWALSVLVVWYSFKILIWAFGLLPWVGKHIPLPHSGGKTGEAN